MAKKYLKVYMGVVSGSPGGRDDGYPIQKTQLIESTDELTRTFDKSATYYKLDEISTEAVEQVVDLLTGL